MGFALYVSSKNEFRDGFVGYAVLHVIRLPLLFWESRGLIVMYE
jgi:hypothetical protein